jgi:hypothetical protein
VQESEGRSENRWRGTVEGEKVAARVGTCSIRREDAGDIGAKGREPQITERRSILSFVSVTSII